MREFMKRLLCRHGPWRILNIEWDGVTVCECRKCGKIKRVPL